VRYLVRGSRPFGEIEAQVISALEHMGLLVQRTFSLHSAAGAAWEGAPCPGFSVLLVHSPLLPPAGFVLVTLYSQAGWAAIQAQIQPGPAEQHDRTGSCEGVAAAVASVLKLCDLELLAGPAGSDAGTDIL
jgi:hypothetical protein